MPVIDKIKEAVGAGVGTAAHNHQGAPPAASSASSDEQKLAALPKRDSPVFDKSLITVIFVLGGPGVGKGTQCEKLVKDYGFVHLSAGDLLRAEQNRPGSTYGEMISKYIREGLIVPMEVTVKLLENAMGDALASPPAFPADSPLAAGWQGGKGRFLIDGFPRKLDQAHEFDRSVCECTFVLFFSCTEEIMLERLTERGKTSGREDDNHDSILKRFRTFVDTSMPVVDEYRSKNKVVEIDAKDSKDAVYAKVRAAVDQTLASKGQQ